MKVNRARKMRIYPNEIQQQKIDNTLNCSRAVYNMMLERNIKIYKRRGDHLNYYSMAALLPEMKKYYPWLKEADSTALQQSCKDLNAAYQNFFAKRAGSPKFHSRNGRQSYRSANMKCACVMPGKIKIPHIGIVETSDMRELPGKLCHITISRETNGKYYVSVTYQEEISVPEIQICKGNVIGLYYKPGKLLVASNGTEIDMPDYYRHDEKRLAILQRQLSKKVGCKKNETKSNNYKKLLNRIDVKHTHIANQRRDYLQKLSTAIANQYDVVCVENIDLREMSSKKAGNGKAINDNGYGMLRVMLEYKLAERGKQLIKVDKPDLTFENDRDAAIYIKNEGLKKIGLN